MPSQALQKVLLCAGSSASSRAPPNPAPVGCWSLLPRPPEAKQLVHATNLVIRDDLHVQAERGTARQQHRPYVEASVHSYIHAESTPAHRTTAAHSTSLQGEAGDTAHKTTHHTQAGRCNTLRFVRQLGARLTSTRSFCQRPTHLSQRGHSTPTNRRCSTRQLPATVARRDCAESQDTTSPGPAALPLGCPGITWVAGRGSLCMSKPPPRASWSAAPTPPQCSPQRDGDVAKGQATLTSRWSPDLEGQNRRRSTQRGEPGKGAGTRAGGAASATSLQSRAPWVRSRTTAALPCNATLCARAPPQPQKHQKLTDLWRVREGRAEWMG